MKRVPILQLQNISFEYTKEQPVLCEVSVDIYSGERISVLGSNGAGKSTFFLCCNGVLQPSKGKVLLEGAVSGHKKSDRMRLHEAVGLVFQDPEDQIIASTVEAEISFGPLNRGLSIEQVQQRVDEAIDAMDLEQYRQRPPHYLSGGEKKRVTIADMLAMQPKLMLFDEPTSSLDMRNAARLQDTFEDLGKSGMALMVATHDVNFVYTWAERILVFHEGRLLADSSPLQIFADNALLETVGLRKPLVYEMVEIICRCVGVSLPENPPKTMEEFTAYMEGLAL